MQRELAATAGCLDRERVEEADREEISRQVLTVPEQHALEEREDEHSHPGLLERDLHVERRHRPHEIYHDFGSLDSPEEDPGTIGTETHRVEQCQLHSVTIRKRYSKPQGNCQQAIGRLGKGDPKKSGVTLGQR